METVKMYQEGMSLRAISEKLNKSHEWVRKELLKNNITLRGKSRTPKNVETETKKQVVEMLKQDHTIQYIIDTLKVTRRYIKSISDKDTSRGWVARAKQDELRPQVMERYTKHKKYKKH